MTEGSVCLLKIQGGGLPGRGVGEGAGRVSVGNGGVNFSLFGAEVPIKYFYACFKGYFPETFTNNLRKKKPLRLKIALKDA